MTKIKDAPKKAGPEIRLPILASCKVRCSGQMHTIVVVESKSKDWTRRRPISDMSRTLTRHTHAKVLLLDHSKEEIRQIVNLAKAVGESIKCPCLEVLNRWKRFDSDTSTESARALPTSLRRVRYKILRRPIYPRGYVKISEEEYDRETVRKEKVLDRHGVEVVVERKAKRTFTKVKYDYWYRSLAPNVTLMTRFRDLTSAIFTRMMEEAGLNKPIVSFTDQRRYLSYKLVRPTDFQPSLSITGDLEHWLLKYYYTGRYRITDPMGLPYLVVGEPTVEYEKIDGREILLVSIYPGALDIVRLLENDRFANSYGYATVFLALKNPTEWKLDYMIPRIPD